MKLIQSKLPSWLLTAATALTLTASALAYHLDVCVWNETVDCDGVQQEGETAAVGIPVKIFYSNGDPALTRVGDDPGPPAEGVTGEGGCIGFVLFQGDPSRVVGGFLQVYVQITTPLGTFLSPATVQAGDDPAVGVTFVDGTSEDIGLDGIARVLRVGLCREVDGPGTGTPGYWKNHPDAWPVDEIEIGCETYSKEDAIALMKAPTSKDKTYNLFEQLVAAKLNVLIGNTSDCIDDTIEDADEWLCAHPVGSGVEAKSDAWGTAGPLHTKLNDYNNGLLCAPSRDE